MAGIMPVMSLPADLDQLSADELRQLVIRQANVLAENSRELNWRQGKIDKLTHELAMHKRWRFGAKTEHCPVEQRQLFEETIDADLAAMEEELAQLSATPPKAKGQAKRQRCRRVCRVPIFITNRNPQSALAAAR